MGRLRRPTAKSSQILGYMVRLFDRFHREHKNAGQLPFVVPVVLYHGEQHIKYMDLTDLFDKGMEPFFRYIPAFHYELANLTEETDDFLRGAGVASGLLLLFKHIRDRDLPSRVGDILDLVFDMAEAETGLKSMELYLRYIMAGASTSDPEELLKALEEKGGDTMPSLANKIYNEGLEQGIQQGIQQGVQQGIQQGVQQGIQKGVESLREVIIDLLEMKFGPEGLTLCPKVKRLNNLEDLQRVRHAIKAAKTLDDLKKAL